MPIEQEAGLVGELVWKFWRENFSLVPTRFEHVAVTIVSTNSNSTDTWEYWLLSKYLVLCAEFWF